MNNNTSAGTRRAPLWVFSGSNNEVANAGLIMEPRTDGIFDGINTIQGVRSYDDAAANWTSPDAYADEVDDPMSQKPYMWNRNDPVGYADPTGFVSWIGVNTELQHDAIPLHQSSKRRLF